MNSADITQLLHRAEAGDAEAHILLLPQVTQQRPRFLADGSLVRPTELAASRALRGDFDSVLERSLHSEIRELS